MVQPFASNIEARAFYLVFSLWLLSEIVGAGIIPRLRRHQTQIKRKEYRSYGFMMVSIFVSFYIANVFALSGIAKLPSGVFYPGIILMVLGVLLRQWSIALLGRFFSSIVAIQEGHKVVDKGPYRLVRHPSYTGAFLIFVGLGLALQSWGAILLLVLMFGLAYGYRMYKEEKAMISELGDEYIKYSKRTKRLIPYVL